MLPRTAFRREATMKAKFLVLISFAVLTPAYGEAPFADFSLGPYPSAVRIFANSIVPSADLYNADIRYTDCGMQGYLLQAIATYLKATKDEDPVPGISRDMLICTAFREIYELMASSDRVLGGGPAFGRADGLDAFNDNIANPPFSSYAFQSGLVALGIAQFLEYLHDSGEYDRHLEAPHIEAFLGEMIRYWDIYYEEDTENDDEIGYWWYSNSEQDAKPVHNTNALLSMASQIYYETTDDRAYSKRPLRYSLYLKKRLLETLVGGYKWNYAEDPAPASSRIPDDISHAHFTLQFLRFANQRDLPTPGAFDMGKVSISILNQMWSEHPARMKPRIDGSSLAGDTEEEKRNWSSAAVIGLAVHADALIDKPEVFDYARSVLVSSYLTHFRKDLDRGKVDPARSLALAKLLLHRPRLYDPDSKWSIIAGDGDSTIPTIASGGVRFDAEWNPPAGLRTDGLTLSARSSRVANSSIIIDLPDSGTPKVVVSLTYFTDTDGAVVQQDGGAYTQVSVLPKTDTDTGSRIWMRTSFMIDKSRIPYTDAQAGVPGMNILLRFTKKITLHKIEATPID